MKIDELVEGVQYTRKTGFIYKVRDGYFLTFKLSEGWKESSYSYYEFNNMRFTEYEFKPESRDRCYSPSFKCKEGWEWFTWLDTEVDKRIKKTVGVYPTREQAIAKSKELGWVE